MGIFISVLITILIVFTIWNLITLNSLKNDTLKNDTLKNESKFKDKKYFELKYRIEFLGVISSIIIVAFGFLGYYSIENVKNELKEDAKKNISNYDSAFKMTDYQITKIDSSTKILKSILANLNSSIAKVEDKISTGFNDVDNLTQKISNINNKNILKQNFYIVDSVKIKLADFVESGKQDKLIYRFKELRTNLGNKLPSFKKPPIIILTPSDGIEISVMKVTTEYIQLSLGNSNLENEYIYFNMVIIEN